MPNENLKKVYVQAALYGSPAQIEAAVEALFCSLPATKKLQKTSRVVIKPNLLAPHAPEKAVTTHPDVLRAVILAVQRRGGVDITVADSPGGNYTPKVMRQVYEACGIAAVCAQTGVKMDTACTFGPCENPGGALVKQFNIISPVQECDFLINLPKLKSHVMTVMSGAVKNIFGCVPGLQKAEFHMQHPQKERFGEMLVDLCETVRPTIHIVDGVLAMEGDGPSGGAVRECGLLFAGENPYTLDLALCRYMSLAPMQVPFLAAASKRGLCGPVFEEELLVAAAPGLEKSFDGFTPPRSYDGPLDFSGSLPPFLRGLMPLVKRMAAPRPVIKKKDCIGCGRCATICPQKVIDMQRGKARIAYQNCIKCFCCHEMCPVKAIRVHRNPLLHRQK